MRKIRTNQVCCFALSSAVESECHVARSAAQVQYSYPRTAEGGIEGPRRAVPPQPVHVHGQDVVQKVVLRRNRAEHIAYCDRGGSFVGGANRCGPHDLRLHRGTCRAGLLSGSRHDFDSRAISVTAFSTASFETLFTTSTSPIALAMMKCGTPPTVFLSDWRSRRTRLPSVTTSGSGP